MTQWHPRVLLITGSLDCGGAQRVLSDMANYWARRGWHVTLGTWSGSNVKDFYPLAPEITRVWFDSSSGGASWFATLHSTVRRIFKLRRWLAISRVDAVLSFIDVSNVHVIFAAAGLAVRVIACERTHPGVNSTVSLPWRILRRISYRWAEQVVAQTQEAASWIEKECHVRPVVIPNAIRALPPVDSVRESLIVGVGRLAEEKGFDLLLSAFAVVAPTFPNWRVALIGDGPQRPMLVAMSERLKISDRVLFVGEIREVETWLARAALVVQPSRREGFPNAVMEAMAMGVAVISADCRSGPSDLIENGVNGRLVPVEDVTALAQAIAELIQNSDLRFRFGRQAMKIRQLYDSSLIMKEWELCLRLPAAAGIDGL